MKKILFCVGLLIAGANISNAQSTLTATTTEIKNGTTVVATYTRTETRAQDDKVTMIRTFTGKDGSEVAIATIPYQQNAPTTVKTGKDGQKHIITLKGKMDTDMAAEIANLLAEKKYL